MDTSSVNLIELLDQAENVALLRWNDLNAKCKFLEESLNEVNSEKENLKVKLALSQQRAGEIELERDRLAQIVKELDRHILTSPFHKLIGKLRQGVDVLETSDNSVVQPVATDYNRTFNNQIFSDTRNESNSFCYDLTMPKVGERNNGSSTEPATQYDTVSSKHLVNSSCSTKNADSSEINESTIGKDNKSLSLVTDQTTTHSDAEDDVLITGDDTNSDIELVLSDDENFEPPLFDKELVICLPMIEFIPKEEPVSCESSDCDSSASNNSPQSCIICEEIFATEDELTRHIKNTHLNQFYEMKKLAVDFREKPKLLPRLRSRDKRSQISTVSSSQIKTKSKREEKNSEENVEAKDFKKSKQSSPVIIRNNQSFDTTPIETPVENSVGMSTLDHPKSPSHFTATSITKIIKRNQCLICKKDGHEKILKDFDALDVHILEEHPDSRQEFYFRCHYKEGTCKRHFTHFNFFKKHVILDHQEEISANGSLLDGSSPKIRRYCCKICDETFHNGVGLNKHLNRCHVGDGRLLTCPDCSHVFQNNKSMLRHQRIHRDNSPFTQD